MSDALNADIREMLTELGNPPLVDRIHPNGWINSSLEKRIGLHDLCLRTFKQRSKTQEPSRGK